MVVLSEIPEGSSSFSPTHVHSSSSHVQNSSTHVDRYDVFLSFRGVDTHHSFTNHLHKTLLNANISTFLDDEEIETGEDLKPESERAIKTSQASIIVLSKNYATSTWCLDELVLILEQRITSNHIVIPIFYHVEPTHVRWQEGSFGVAMAKHKQTMDEEKDANKRSQWAQKIDRWTKALTKVADLKGINVKQRLETEFIEEIVKDIHHRLHIPLRSAQLPLIGMDHHMNFVSSWLKDPSSHEADILTIFGMGGIGKTSLAKHVYGLHCCKFQSSSFIGDISRRCDGKFNGLLDVQKQLCNDISKTSLIQVHDVAVYTSKIENVVARKRVFLILDDVDTIDQLDALLGTKAFHPGSKIIITTKDKWLTKSCALFKTNIKPNHVELLLEGLDETESLQLLCFHAFMCNHPKAGYEQVSDELEKYCEGHPLALEVLGKLLHNQDVSYWEDIIEGLKKETNSRINNVLRMSFASLPSRNNKELFKYIACYFVGTDRDVTETILEACDIKTRSGIKNLIDRCLLSIGGDNKLEMHQLVQEMGRFEVHQESPDKPWKRHLLWSHKESFIVLNRKKGKGNVKGLALDMRMLEKEKSGASVELTTDALSNMDSLMILQLNYVHMNGSYENFPEELISLCLHGFCLKCIPSDLPMENLVALDMSYSNIESFVDCYSDQQQPEKRQKLDGLCLKDKRLLPSLKILNLSFCEQLYSLGDFDQLPALERLIVIKCISLVEVCESIKHCDELVLIDLSYCTKLQKLPRNIGMLKKVKTVLLDGCNLKIKDMDSLELCNAKNLGINTRTSSSYYSFVGDITRDLKFLSISLPRSLVTLSLIDTNLSTESFPMDFTYLSMLKELFIDGNPIDSMPSCVRTLPRLETLTMCYCNKLKSVEHPPLTVRELLLFSSRINPIENIVFDPNMSPLKMSFTSRGPTSTGSYVIEGILKIQEMVDVEETILRSLGWTHLDFLKERSTGTNSSESEIQMFYEFGIFSTVYEHEEMPSWFRHRSVGPSVSFTIPSSPNKLRGLNFCSVHTFQFSDDLSQLPVDNYSITPMMTISHDPKHPTRNFPITPMMTISNVTKNHTWIYERYELDYPPIDSECWVMLSHWMFGRNEMEAGDHLTITVTDAEYEHTKECGVSIVYEEEEEEEGEEEDALVYYKSWNHIIGGDLSPFQTTTDQYILNHDRFSYPGIVLFPYHRKFIPDGPNFQEVKKGPWFRALSPRKPHVM